MGNLVASTGLEDGVAYVVARALEESGGRSTGRATNLVFEHLTGVDPYTLLNIFMGDAPVRTEVGAKRLRNQLAELLDARQADAGALLGASESRFSRNDSLDKDILDRTHAILDTYMTVAAALGPDGATRWFSSPHASLGDETPMVLLKTTYGRKLVDDLVAAALAGSYT